MYLAMQASKFGFWAYKPASRTPPWGREQRLGRWQDCSRCCPEVISAISMSICSSKFCTLLSAADVQSKKRFSVDSQCTRGENLRQDYLISLGNLVAAMKTCGRFAGKTRL